MKKNGKIVYIDMDGVLADFQTGVDKLTEEQLNKYERPTLIPEFFINLPTVEGAKEAVEKLADKYDLFVLSTAPWDNPQAWSEKRIWLQRHFPEFKRRLILSHRKDLLRGDFLIDDREANGASDFQGEHIHFRQPPFSDWEQVLNYLLNK